MNILLKTKQKLFMQPLMESLLVFSVKTIPIKSSILRITVLRELEKIVQLNIIGIFMGHKFY